MKRRLLIAVPMLCLVALIAWFVRPRREVIGEAYISEKVTPLLSSIAQVKEQVALLHYGERVEVLSKRNEHAKVRTIGGVVGWVDSRQLMEPELWQKSIKLLDLVKPMPVQARGRTKVSANLRVQPGRLQPRLYQFGRNAPVEIVGRGVADWVQVADEKDTGNDSPEIKKEDWFLIRGIATRQPGEVSSRGADTTTTTQPGEQTAPVAGWVVARFIELDLPDAVKEGAASANLRPMAWFELNRVSDSSGDKPQYLLAATRGSEGQACDFTALRVYTWYAKKSQYETAFIENDLCGQLPVIIGTGPRGEPEFRFHVKDGKKGQQVFRLYQTVVRRVREPVGTSNKDRESKSTKPAAN
jgi:hypothetical protein